MRLLTTTAVAVLLAATPVSTVLAQESAQQATSQQATAPTSVDDFAEQAAQNSMAEVLMSTMALQKTSDKRVQDYAWTMLDHHSRAMGDLAEVLSADAADLPSEPSADQKATLERMRGLKDQEFDKAYFEHQVTAHERAVTLFQQAQDLSDEKVANYAHATAPVLRAHLEIAQFKQNQAPEPMPGQ